MGQWEMSAVAENDPPTDDAVLTGASRAPIEGARFALASVVAFLLPLALAVAGSMAAAYWGAGLRWPGPSLSLIGAVAGLMVGGLAGRPFIFGLRGSGSNTPQIGAPH